MALIAEGCEHYKCNSTKTGELAEHKTPPAYVRRVYKGAVLLEHSVAALPYACMSLHVTLRISVARGSIRRRLVSTKQHHEPKTTGVFRRTVNVDGTRL